MSYTTSSYIISTTSTFNSTDPNLSVSINGLAINSYAINQVPVFSSCGVISKPMPNKTCLFKLLPSGTTGYVEGFANELPDPTKNTNNVSDITDGETAITETSNFNFNIKAKLDKLLSTFTNSSNQTIDTNLPISENIVTMLTNISAEIIALEIAYNTVIDTLNGFMATFASHVHSGGTLPSGSTGGTSSVFPNNNNYTATSNFTSNYNFITISPSQMYINLNGKKI